MRLSIHQPAYLPWLGYFHRIAISDLHVVLDSVQFEKNSFINRNRVRTSRGWCWLTVPVATKGQSADLTIDEVQIPTGGRWAEKHWTTLVQNYGRTPYFADHRRFFEDTFGRPWHFLSELTRHLTDYLLDALAIDTSVVYSSRLEAGGKKDHLILNLCEALGASTYVSGPLGRQYLDHELFAEHGISVSYHDYRHPVYRQGYPGFEPLMAAVDLLFNCGPESFTIMSSDHGGHSS